MRNLVWAVFAQTATPPHHHLTIPILSLSPSPPPHFPLNTCHPHTRPRSMSTVSLPGYTISADQLVRTDPSSFANPTFVQTTNFHVDLVPDFDAQIFHTVLDLEVVIRDASAVVLSLDHKGQSISSVVQLDALQGQVVNEAVVYQASAETCPLGDRLVVGLPQQQDRKVGDKLYYRFTYTTSPEASAIQFLPSAQSGTDNFYVYTQCQAIHGRSVLIIQDTCSSKVKWSAAVRVPQPLVVVMSALPTSPSGRFAEPTSTDEEKKTQLFTFRQEVPIPPYLYALCIGILEQRELSDRCGVIAIPNDIEVAKREYAEVEKVLTTIESFAGPYQFGKYFINSMPASFPFGGMEGAVTFMSNSLLPLPRQTFLAANSKCFRCQSNAGQTDETILGIATSVLAHEASHSWAGNLTTNHNWQEFWLNEGFCVFLEWRALQKLFGAPYESLHRLIGWEDLKDSVAMYEEMGCPQATSLITDLTGDVDPDDYFSSVPYMKGSAFMIYLEDIMGGAALFEPFMKKFFSTFAMSTFTSQDFKAFYLSHCKENNCDQRVQEIDWEKWLYHPGMPPVQPKVDMTLANQCYDLAALLTDPAQPPVPAELVLGEWKSTQQTVFIDRLVSLFDAQFDAAKADAAAKAQVQAFWRDTVIPAVTKQHNFGPSINCELLSRWLHLLVKVGQQPDFIVSDDQVTLAETLHLLLAGTGRMKFLRPTVRLMLKSANFRALGKQYYTSLRQQYHTIASTMTDKDIVAAEGQETVY